MMPTQISANDPTLTAIQAYLAGDIAGVQQAYAPIVDLLGSLYAGVDMPSSECSPCLVDAEDTIVDLGSTIGR
jgi:hypothetical protein